MTNSRKQYLDIIRQTRRCRSDIEDTAQKLADLSHEVFEDLVNLLIRSGEDTTLGIVFNICAVNGVPLDPTVAAEALKVIEPIIDFAPIYRFQGKTAIPPLLEAAQSEELSIERQVYAGLIAAEMSVLHEFDPQPVRHVLNKLEHAYSLTPMLAMMLAGARDLLESENNRSAEKDFLSRTDVLKLLPKERPPVVIGSGQTIRRPIAKLGRNAPCHCGSGKKYKKCCLEKERELLRDASPYAGVTMSQLRASPRLVDDTKVINDMRAYELKKLVPAALNIDQLFAAYHRCERFGLRELAFDMLKDLERRPDNHDFDKGHFVDLMDSTMVAGEMALAEQIRQHIPVDILIEPELTQLQFELLHNNETMEKLDVLLQREMTRPDDHLLDPPLIDLSYKFEKTFPALSIVFARAFITANPDRITDNDALLDTIRKARTEIGIEAWDDPIEDYVEWSFGKDLDEFQEKNKSEKLNQLIRDVEATRKEAREKEKELRQKESALEALSARLEKKKNQSSQPEPSRMDPHTSPTPPQAETIVHLTQKIEKLKGEIGSQQQIRRDLRTKLRNERAKSLKQEPISQAPPDQRDAGPLPTTPKSFKTVLVPEYSAAFCRACKTVPPPIAAKAIKAIAAFAAADEAIWRVTRPIKRITECYRIRVGRSYRIMLRWKPDKTIQALDLIPRAQLEVWIRKNS